MRQYVAYAKWLTSTNRRRSDGTPLDGRHGICGLCDGSGCCITKWHTLSWFDLTRFCTTVRVSKREWVMFESSSKNRKSWTGQQMIWQCIPATWSNKWEWFGGFTWRNTYWQRRRRAEWRDRRDVTEPKFLCDHSSNSILDTLKASQIWNGYASQRELQKSGANYCCTYGFKSLSSKRT